MERTFVSTFHYWSQWLEHLVSCCHRGIRLTALPLRLAHITAAINYLMGHTAYISLSITDLLSLVKPMASIHCDCSSLLCFGLPPALHIPDLKGHLEGSHVQAEMVWKTLGARVDVCIFWCCLQMISGSSLQEPLITGGPHWHSSMGVTGAGERCCTTSCRF